MSRQLSWDELAPYERQQGGYWEYGHGEDVYGNGRAWVPVANPATAGQPKEPTDPMNWPVRPERTAAERIREIDAFWNRGLDLDVHRSFVDGLLECALEVVAERDAANAEAERLWARIRGEGGGPGCLCPHTYQPDGTLVRDGVLAAGCPVHDAGARGNGDA